MTRHLALASLIAVAPDALFPLGGYPGDEDKARELFAKLEQTKTREDFVSAYEAATYPGTQHGFNNDTTPRCNAAAAQQAWDRTLALFDRTLR